MTKREEILAMVAGRFLDAEVHQKVMGRWGAPIPFYSSSTSAAWSVIKKIKGEEGWRIGDTFIDILEDMAKGERLLFWVTPEAICKAALLAKAED